jgi:hypothetical protein
VDSLNACGGNAQFSVSQDMKIKVRVTIYAESDLVEWFLLQALNNFILLTLITDQPKLQQFRLRLGCARCELLSEGSMLDIFWAGTAGHLNTQLKS